MNKQCHPAQKVDTREENKYSTINCTKNGLDKILPPALPNSKNSNIAKHPYYTKKLIQYKICQTSSDMFQRNKTIL
jgi:hypothetical protein